MVRRSHFLVAVLAIAPGTARALRPYVPVDDDLDAVAESVDDQDAEGLARLRLAFVGLSTKETTNASFVANVQALSEFVQSEIGALGVYDVMGAEEVASLLTLEQQRQILGCSATAEGCGQAPLQALDASRLLTGNLVRIGSKYVLNLSLVNLETRRNIGRTARYAASLEHLLEQVRGALVEIVSADEAARPRLRLVLARAEENKWMPPEGWTLALRVDGELLASTQAEVPGLGMGAGAYVAWRVHQVGLAMTVLARPLGLRIAGRLHPIQLGAWLPYLEAGGVVFTDSLSVRGAFGAEVQVWRLRLLFDVAYELGIADHGAAFWKDPSHFAPHNLLIGFGVGYAIE
jgi:hypothetical protein